MRPLDLPEFIAQLRLEGCKWAEEIADNLEFVETSEHLELVEDLEHYVKTAAPDLMGKPRRIAEWLGDRSDLLGELEDRLDKAGCKGDIGDTLEELLQMREDLEEVREALQARGWLDEGGDVTIAALSLPYNL